MIPQTRGGWYAHMGPRRHNPISLRPPRAGSKAGRHFVPYVPKAGLRTSCYSRLDTHDSGNEVSRGMNDSEHDVAMRQRAFDHVRRLTETHAHLTAAELNPGFVFRGERIPLVNPQRGIFKPRQMRFLLSIKTVYPRPGARVWYDDQREVHRQIFAGDELVDYAFMGNDPTAADNRWLREAMENQIPLIYFLGVAPGRYQAMVPTFVVGWDADALKAHIAFGVPDEDAAQPPQTAPERRYALREVTSTGFIRHRFVKRLSRPITGAVRFRACPSRCCLMQPTSCRTGMRCGGSRWCPTAFLYQRSITRPSMPI